MRSRIAKPVAAAPMRSLHETANVNALADADLVAALGHRSQAALEEIHRRYGGAVWAVARRVCRAPDLAEEVSQTVFVELWSKPERFDPALGKLRTWLVTQAHSRAVDVVRSEASRRRRHEREAQFAAPAATEVDAIVQEADLAAGVRRAVDQLPRLERDAILLAYFGGHSYRETAAMLGQPEGTVKSRIRSALERLRHVLEAEGVAP